MCYNETYIINNGKNFMILNIYYTLICLFIVTQNSVIKYMTKIGQNTGILKHSKKVHIKPITVLFVTEYQNLNSGNLLINGLNSSFALVGNSGPLSSAAKYSILLHIYLIKTKHHTIKVHCWINFRCKECYKKI